ncbi:hypothetical protein BRYFOR_05823 [Marvinbryantia formatexigens DSM 14469]|uniref:Uncharacterized protein n=1 Tax=Marvinbryantia formatexigens DSM 14469 TaxID=478749 RepID=C6LB28_9FIRM|nr:hypothetical protein BRYFOR_05823 [Marvinbryantia formatexigens DSM 14469]
MRSAPGVWYTGGNYEKIYLLVGVVSLTVYSIATRYEQIMNAP